MRKLFVILTLLVAVGAGAKSRLEHMLDIKYGSEPARIKGLIKDYTTKHKEVMLCSYVAFGSNESTTANSVISTMYPSEPSDGTFELEIPVKFTDRVSLTFRDHTYIILLAPGEEVNMKIEMKLLENPNPKKPAVVFSGYLADFNNDLYQYGGEYESMKILEPIQSREGLDKLRGLSVSQYRDFVLKLYEDAKKKMMADKRLCGAFKEYVDATYQYQTIIKTLLYNTTLNVANETEKTYERPADYYDYLQTMQPFANVAHFYTMSTLAALQTCNLVKNFSSQTNLKIHPSTRQLQTANKYLQSIAEFNELNVADIETIKNECPGLSDAILLQNDMLLQRIEAAKYSTSYKIVNIDENLTGGDIFKALIAPYKGKPLLVDFWATWCGPCKAAMKTIQPVKEELAGKVNFIYVTGPSSPKKTWEMTIPDIHGDHYYVTESQYSELLKQFDSNGIPTYVIVDKEGNVKNKYIGYPGNEVMEEQLR